MKFQRGPEKSKKTACNAVKRKNRFVRIELNAVAIFIRGKGTRVPPTRRGTFVLNAKASRERLYPSSFRAESISRADQTAFTDATIPRRSSTSTPSRHRGDGGTKGGEKRANRSLSATATPVARWLSYK